MVDPDSIQIQLNNLPGTILIERVPEFEGEIYNLEDDSDYSKFIKDVKREVRRSFEYRRFIRFLRENFGMDRCAILQNISNEETYSIKIEIHHYPFGLEDIVKIVTKKRTYYNESLDIQMVAKEVMQLHYKCIIGLIPLSETAHELFHNGRLFLPVDKVFGRYSLFIEYYGPFCNENQLDALNRIEKYTKEHTEVNDTTILELNPVEYNIKPTEYQLPNFENVVTDMNYQLDMIKNNNFLLPNVAEVRDIINTQNDPNSAIQFHAEPIVIDIPTNTTWNWDYKK